PQPVEVVDDAVQGDAAALFEIAEPVAFAPGINAAAVGTDKADPADLAGLDLRLDGLELLEVTEHVAHEELDALGFLDGVDGLLALLDGAAEGLLAEDVFA